MKKIKQFLLVSIFMMAITIVTTSSYAKYVINRNIIIATIYIDRTPPVGSVNYSYSKIPNNDTIVIINLNEPICDVEGWTLLDNKMTLTKSFKQNSKEEITIVDLAGNEGKVEINVENKDN